MNWYTPASIPNRHGFELVVKLRDGSERPARVVLGEDGLHRLDGIGIADVVHWRFPREPASKQ